jgi:hypothetical protein
MDKENVVYIRIFISIYICMYEGMCIHVEMSVHIYIYTIYIGNGKLLHHKKQILLFATT